MASVKLPDASFKEIPDGSSVMQLAESIGKGLAKAAVAGRVDGKVVDLSHKLTGAAPACQILTERDPDALLVLRHSTAHVMAEAIQRLWPQAQLAYGPPLETGFYYDIALDAPISSNDFPTHRRGDAADRRRRIGRSPATKCRSSQGMQRLKQRGQQVQDRQRRARQSGRRGVPQLVRHRREGQELGRPVHGPARAQHRARSRRSRS